MSQREILFKAKRTDNVEWVEGYYVEKVDPLLGIRKSFILNQVELSSLCHWYQVDPETVCQYTGRKDAKGMKIFSCDKLFFDLENRIYIVTWDFLKSSFNLVCGDIENGMIGAPYCVIVGNIHDN